MSVGHDPHAFAHIPRITAAETAERMRRGEQLLVVDVRREAARRRGHVAGDYHYPRREYAERRGELPRDVLLVLY